MHLDISNLTSKPHFSRLHKQKLPQMPPSPLIYSFNPHPDRNGPAQCMPHSPFMAEFDPANAAASSHHHQHLIHRETALQSLNTIIQLHFEKTLEKKRAVDVQKKELWKLFQLFFLFLGLVFLAQSNSPTLQCRHCWVPIGLLSLAHLIFYVSVAQTLRCINGFKYQRRCHKLTLGLATERLRQLRIKMAGGGGAGGVIDEYGDEYEIPYQEPPDSYFGKFKRNWILHFGFLIFVYGFMVSSSVVMLCF